MNTMMKALVLGVTIVFLCSFSGCKKIDFLNPCLVPPAKVPAKTSKGLNTFGCKVNGKSWSYTPKIYLWPFERPLYCVYTDIWSHLSITAERNYLLSCDSTAQIIKLGISDLDAQSDGYLGYHIRGFSDYLLKCNNKVREYELDTLQPYGVHFYHKDLKKRIFSGTFYFTAISRECPDTVRITDGVFDIVADPG